MVEKCMRKYSPTNCAVSTNFMFKQVFADFQPEIGKEQVVKRKLRRLEPLSEKRLEVADKRNQTPDFPMREEKDREVRKVRDRDFTLKTLKVCRSITPDPFLTPTTQHTSRHLFSTSPKSSNIVDFTTSSGNTTIRDDSKGTGQTPNTQLSSEVTSPILEPRYHTEPPLSLAMRRAPRRTPRLKDLIKHFEDYEGTNLIDRESPRNKEFLLRQHQEVRNFIQFLPEMPGERLKLATVSHYLHARKYLSKGEFIDKSDMSKCVAQKADISVFICKRLGKSKIWHHTGRAISTRFENELRSYWH